MLWMVIRWNYVVEHLENTGEIGLFKIKQKELFLRGSVVSKRPGEAAQNFADEKIADLASESEELSKIRKGSPIFR